MIPFDEDEIKFLTEFKVSFRKVMNVQGMKKRQWAEHAKKLRFKLIWGSKCRKGHQLKTRYGHCVFCNPDSLSHQQRNENNGLLIIAKSKSRTIFWVGIRKEPEVRVLNDYCYGGSTDWEVWRQHKSTYLGRKEWEILKSLDGAAHPITLAIEGGQLYGEDIFNCQEHLIQSVWEAITTGKKPDVLQPGQIIQTKYELKIPSSISAVLPKDSAAENLKATQEKEVKEIGKASKKSKIIEAPFKKQETDKTLLQIIRCPHCSKKYRISWPTHSRDFCCKECHKWFRTILATSPYQNDFLYFDIETTGLSPERDEITTIVWWSAENGWGHWVLGENKNSDFQKIWHHSRHVVTYNGIQFDEPFLMRHMKVPSHPKHIDLMRLGHKEGLKGGLKKICKMLKIGSPVYLDDTDGKEAIHLWLNYQNSKDESSLKRLLHYNAWDVVLNYRLHQNLMNKTILAIEERIPFKWM